MSTTPETPNIVAPRWDSLITGAAVGIVAGIGIGVVATSKNVMESTAAAAAGAGAGSAIAYFVADYRHTHRRNVLHAQLDRASAERNQLDQQVQSANATIAQLQTQVQDAHDRYEQLATAADTEIGSLKAALATATITPQPAADEPVESLELDAPELPLDALQAAATSA